MPHSGIYFDFHQEVRQAKAQSRVAAEAEVRLADPSKLPHETEPPDRSEEERDLAVAGEGDEALGYAAGAAGLVFVGSSSSRQRGSLVHDVLFRCDLTDPHRAEDWSERLCRERGVPELEGKVAAHAQRVIGSQVIKRVLASNRVLRELPVSHFDGESYVEGYIDIVFQEDDGWVILDYKTDDLRQGQADLVRRYEPQLAAYKKALEAVGISVKQKGLWFTANGEAVFA